MAPPKVRSRFEAVRADGRAVRLQIRDATKETHRDIMDFMVGHFMRDETLNSTIGIERDPLAVEEFRRLQSSHLKHNLVQVCALDDPSNPEIVGFSLATPVDHRAAEPVRMESFAMKKLLEVFDEFAQRDDAFERFGVDELLGDAGLSVSPDYRGLGIATRLLKARNEMCSEVGFKVSAAAFTSEASQRAAVRAGYRVYRVVPAEALSRRTGLDFGGCADVKLMAHEVP